MRRLSLSLRRLLLIGAIVFIMVAISFVAFQPSKAPNTEATAIFDFDTGVPPLVENQNTPFNQTSNGITAYFSSPSDKTTASAFSIQSSSTTSFELSQFSGRYLFDNNPSRDILDIKFSVKIVAINFTFATVEHYGGAIRIPSDILLTVYENTNFVGTTKAYGSFSGDSYPQGTLSFRAGHPFDWVRISIPAQTSGTTDFLIDNIVVAAVT